MNTEIYPLTVVKDRYTGAYSGGKYTAWNLKFHQIPIEIDSDDSDCVCFWNDNQIPVGIGNTIYEAINNLKEKLNESN